MQRITNSVRWRIWVLIFLLTCSLAAAKKETTVRNVTGVSVDYTIEIFGENSKVIQRSLKKGRIDRFPGNSRIDITFQRGDETIAYGLTAGCHYSFRYDENGLVDLFRGSHGRAGVLDLAPFVATPMAVVEKMLALAELKRSDVVYDLGCGDGRIVILAAKQYGARGVGVDLDPENIRDAKAAAKEAGVEKLVDFRVQDVMKTIFSEATVIVLYLLPESNKLLRPHLERQLKPGTRVISHNYEIPGWEHKEIDIVSLDAEDNEMHDVYVYVK